MQQPLEVIQPVAAGNTIINRLTPEFLDSVKQKGTMKATLAGKPGILGERYGPHAWY